MKLLELLQKYATHERSSLSSEDTNIQSPPEQGELSMDTQTGAVVQRVLSLFPGSRIIETKIIKDSKEDANLDR